MASRALGALFALAAAGAFGASIATSAWWAGPPTINGHVTNAKYVHIGLLGGEGCNTGGDGSCEPVEGEENERIASTVGLGSAGAASLLAFLLSISALRVSDRRKKLAGWSAFFTLLAAGGGGAVFYFGPAIQAPPDTTVDVPIGYGLYVFGGAIAASWLAALLARRIEPEPLRLKSSAPTLQPMAAPAIRAILRGDPWGVA